MSGKDRVAAPFRTAVIDPPWAYARASDSPRLSGYASQEYTSISQDRLKAMPVGDLVDGYLFLWTTGPFVPDALDLLKAWGFEYRTMLYWVKVNRSGGLAYGPGYWVRSVVEPILLASKPGTRAIRTHERAAFMASRGGHSAKPECLQDMVERHFGGPYLEMFARRSRPGWVCLGSELSGLDIMDEIRSQPWKASTSTASPSVSSPARKKRGARNLTFDWSGSPTTAGDP